MHYISSILCSLPSTKVLFSPSNIPTLIYYSHIIILAVTLMLGVYIYSNGKHKLANNALSMVLAAFSGWLILDSIVWISSRPDVIMFSWASLLIFELAVYVGSFYLINVVLNNKDMSGWKKWMIFIIFLPIVFLMPSDLNLSGFNMSTCLAVEGPIALYYEYGLEIFFSLWIIIFSVKKYIKSADKEEKSLIFSVCTGISLFLLFFASGNIIGSFTNNWNLSQFGLFGMPILAGFLIYVIVKQKAFNTKTLGSHSLLFAMIMLTLVQFIYTESLAVKVLNVVSFLIILAMGRVLINNIKKEDKKETLENLTQELYKQNVEMSIKNKTLALLRKLYQISLLNLNPSSLAEKISNSIRADLNMEVVGILTFDQESDSLLPLSFSKSDRLLACLDKLGFHLKDVKIPNVSNIPKLKEAVIGKISTMSDDLNDVWGGLITAENIKIITEESHIKTTLIYPLVTEASVAGILFLGLNREYKTLNEHEKDSIKSIIDVIAVALDRAYLYKELGDANEKLKSLDKLKTEFLSLASHQLRSPLTAIKGYTSMLLEGDFGIVNEKQKEAIDRVFQSSQHLAKVVEDLLNVSKIEQGGMQYVLSPFDMEHTVKDMVNDLSITAEKKGLKISFETDNLPSQGSKLPYMVNGDMEKLRQVILNLIDNSIKYTKEGWIKVRLSKDQNKKIMRLAIQDSGMGMTPEIKASLFQKFSRGDGGKMDAGGSGLGLYLAKKIIEEGHNGRIGVDSEGPSKGSTFWMELKAD